MGCPPPTHYYDRILNQLGDTSSGRGNIIQCRTNLCRVGSFLRMYGTTLNELDYCMQNENRAKGSKVTKVTWHVSRSHSEVYRTEFVGRHDLCAVLQVCKLELQFVVQLRSKRKVVGKYHSGREEKRGDKERWFLSIPRMFLLTWPTGEFRQTKGRESLPLSARIRRRISRTSPSIWQTLPPYSVHTNNHTHIHTGIKLRNHLS